MSQIKHHLSDELLMGYAAGTLPEAFNLVVATHISICDECRARLGAFEAVGGAVLEDVGSTDMSSTLSEVFDIIDSGTEQVRTEAKSSKSEIFPDALKDYIGGDLDSVKWRSIGMGVKQAILPTSRSASARLLYIPAGAKMPDHGHQGTELTLVLQGAFKDEEDRFARGDIEIASEADHHTPVAEEGEPCICLAATDAPLKFNGMIARIAQKFARI
ncbi:MAG: ChrR family anti-sigma-E factor [Pseudomonadota bacterium]